MRGSFPLKPMRWLLVAAAFLSVALLARSSARDIYPDPARAHADLAAALKTAIAEHKRVILVFGGNWCADCLVLDMYMHNPENLPIVSANYVVVHVNVGHYDANLDLAEKYGIPLEKGVPALAVLGESGKLLYSQKAGEFEAIRRMDPGAVTRFLVQWKPGRQGCSMMAVNC